MKNKIKGKGVLGLGDVVYKQRIKLKGQIDIYTLNIIFSILDFNSIFIEEFKYEDNCVNLILNIPDDEMSLELVDYIEKNYLSEKFIEGLYYFYKK